MSEPTIEEMPFQHDQECPCSRAKVAGLGCPETCAGCTCRTKIPAKAAPEKVCPSCKCEPHGGSCIQAGPLLRYPDQATPESYDEAFDRAFKVFNKTLSFTATPTEKIIFREGYNARARLDAERRG